MYETIRGRPRRDSGTFKNGILQAIGYAQELGLGLGIGDFNADGHVDVAWGGLPKGAGVLIGKGDGTFQAPVYYPCNGCNQTSARDVRTADFDGDGRLDLLVANGGSTVFLIHLGLGDGTFAAPQKFNNGLVDCTQIAVADFNGDGRPDVADVYVGTTFSVMLNTSQ